MKKPLITAKSARYLATSNNKIIGAANLHLNTYTLDISQHLTYNIIMRHLIAYARYLTKKSQTLQTNKLLFGTF